MNYIDVRQFETYVSACAGNAGCTVEWDKPTSSPRTNGKTMYLPAITSSTSAEWLARMRYYVKHETAHIVHSDFVFLNKKQPRGLLAMINNLIEDHRIDYTNDSVYAGDCVISNAYWELYHGDVVNSAASDDKAYAYTLPLFAWDAGARDWIGTADSVHSAMESRLDDVGVERYNKLQAYIPELLSIRETGSAEDVYALAVCILNEVYGENAENYENVDESKGKGKGKGKGEDSDDGAGDGSGASDMVDRIVEVEKIMRDAGIEHKADRTGVHMVHDLSIRGSDYIIPNTKDYIVLKFPVVHKEVSFANEHTLKSLVVSNYITNNARPLANKLRIKLQTRSKDRYEYAQKKGKLHTGSLHKLFSGNDSVASKVFRKRVVSSTLDTSVCLLVDCSGSMAGTKFDMACAGAGALAEALKPLNIPYSVLGFTNTVGKEEQPIIWVFNDFNEKIQQSELINRFSRASACLWQNSDGDAIAYAANQLMMHKSHRKVLLVLSDGSPAGRDWAGDINRYTATVVKDVEDMGIDVYGIGICDSNVTMYYKNNVVVNDLDKLSSTILSLIDRSIV